MRLVYSSMLLSLMIGCLQPPASPAGAVSLAAGSSGQQHGIRSYVITADATKAVVELEGTDDAPMGQLILRVVDSRTDHATLRLHATGLVLDVEASPDAVRVASNGRRLADAVGDRVSAEDLGASLSDDQRAAFETIGAVLGDSVLRPRLAVAPDGLLSRQPAATGDAETSSAGCADAAGSCFADGSCGPPSCELYAAHFFWGCYCYGTTGHPCNPFTPWQCRGFCYPNATCS